MISIYRDGENGLLVADGFPPGAWIHAESPSEVELALLQRELGLPPSFLAAAVDPREVARTDTQRGMHLTVVRVPYNFGARERVPFRTTPLGMIIAPNHFLTICRRPIDFVHDLTAIYSATTLPTRRANRMILAILGIVGQWFLRDLEEIDRLMDDVEDRLINSIENGEMMELLRYEKSLVYIKTGLEWNETMVRRLQDGSHFGWTDDDLEMLREVEIEYRQGAHMAATMQAVSGEMTDTFASLISNNLNVVMKFLAAVTIILTVPMLFTSFYGMNVALPGRDTRPAFVVMTLLSIGVTVLVSWWFWRQGWLSFRWRVGSDARDGGDDPGV
ncbi:MAG TPA: magnesium transporter CorA family protein [Promineifilum sp.]|nr:magnesium transporter CorA family protein [Promineifilum sp.]